MKKFLALLGLTLAVVQPAFANEGILSVDAQVKAVMTSVTPFDLINWKVGDKSAFDVKAGSFGKLGTMIKSVTKDEGTTLWLTSDMNLMIQQQKVEMQINKADGKVLKTIVNGKEQAPSDDKIEIISQDYTEVTVPAGTFKCMHIVAKSSQAPHIEVWANPRETVMEGTLKQSITTQGMDVVLELTSFSRAP